ncbi:MAG TPA: DUF2807 domain-containing protein, partial [Usitatibacter sp.]
MNTFRRIVAPFALMSAFLAFAAMAADKRETRPVSGFTGIALAAPINVELVQGDTESLVLEGDEATLAEIETVVEQGVLKIRTRSSFDSRHLSKARALVGAKAIESLRIAGAGDIKAALLRSADLKL